MPTDRKTLSRAERMMGRTLANEQKAAEVNREGRVQGKGDTGVGGLMRQQAHRKADLLDTKYAGGSANAVYAIDTAQIRKSPFVNRLPSAFDPDSNTSFAALLDDIRVHGRNLQPAQVRKIQGAGEGEPVFELITGERRWRCCEILKIPLWAEVVEVDDAGAMTLMFTENQNRKDLSPVETGLQVESFLAAMRDDESGRASRGTVKALAERLGMDRDHVGKLSLIGQIPDEVLASLENPERLTFRVAHALGRACRDQADAVAERLAVLPKKLLENDKQRALFLAGELPDAEPPASGAAKSAGDGLRLRLPDNKKQRAELLGALAALEKKFGVSFGLQEVRLVETDQ